MTKDRKIQLALLILLLVVQFCLGFYKAYYYRGFVEDGDTAQYIHQTTSLLTNTVQDFYSDNKWMMETSTKETRIGPDMYPWGTSLYILPTVTFFGINAFMLKMQMVITHLLLVIIVFLFFSKKEGAWFGLGISALFSFHPLLRAKYEIINSDILYLCLFLSCFYLIDFIYQKNTESDGKYRLLGKVLLGALIVFTIQVRSEGVLLLPIFLLIQYVRTISISRYYVTLLSIAVFAAIFYWFFPYLHISGGPSADLLAFKEHLSLQRFWFYLVKAPSRYFGELQFVYLLLYIPFVVLGAIVSFKKTYPYSFYVSISTLLIIAIGYQGGARYLLIAYLFSLYWFYVGLRFAFGKVYIDQKFPEMICTIITIVMLLSYSYSLLTKMQFGERQNYALSSLEYQSLFALINKETHTEDVISFFKPRVMYLKTGRRSFRAYKGDEYAVVSNAQYYVNNDCHKNERHHLDISGQFEKIDEIPCFTLYKIKK